MEFRSKSFCGDLWSIGWESEEQQRTRCEGSLSHSPNRHIFQPMKRHELLELDPGPIPAVEAYKPGIDRTLLRENLRLTPTQRVEKMIAALRLAEELRNSRPRRNDT